MVSVQIWKNFKEPYFCHGWEKELQTFTTHSFGKGFQKTYVLEFTAIFMCLLLSWSMRYSIKQSSNFNNPFF